MFSAMPAVSIVLFRLYEGYRSGLPRTLVMKSLLFSAVITAAVLTGPAATAQVNRSGYVLPLDLAVEVAHVAVRTCAAQGWSVTAVVVDTAGLIRVQMRGDHSTVHTDVTAFRKGYTVVSMGPIFGFDRSGVFGDLVRASPNGAGSALTTIPNVIALAGGVAIRKGDEIVAAIGVGGAPGGDKDEKCAAAGVAAISDRAR